jgi:hypothetical protein
MSGGSRPQVTARRAPCRQRAVRWKMPGSRIPDPGRPVAVGYLQHEGRRLHPARLTHLTDTSRPASTAVRPHQCGGFPLCGDLSYVYDAQTSAKRKSSALSAAPAAPRPHPPHPPHPPHLGRTRHPQQPDLRPLSPHMPGRPTPRHRRKALHPNGAMFRDASDCQEKLNMFKDGRLTRQCGAQPAGSCRASRNPRSAELCARSNAVWYESAASASRPRRRSRSARMA